MKCSYTNLNTHMFCSVLNLPAASDRIQWCTCTWRRTWMKELLVSSTHAWRQNVSWPSISLWAIRVS